MYILRAETPAEAESWDGRELAKLGQARVSKPRRLKETSSRLSGKLSLTPDSG